MANELEEYNRYWESCVGVYRLEKSNAPRAAAIAGLRYQAHDQATHVPKDWPLQFVVFTSKGQWQARTMPMGKFYRQFTPVSWRSTMINCDKFVGYLYCSTAKQYRKGMNMDVFRNSLRLLDAHLDLWSAWDGNKEVDRPPGGEDFLASYTNPLPDYASAIRDIFSGEYYGRAFNRHFAFINNLGVKYPVFYYKVYQAGVLIDPRTLLLDVRYCDLQRRLDKLLPGVTVRMQDFGVVQGTGKQREEKLADLLMYNARFEDPREVVTTAGNQRYEVRWTTATRGDYRG